VTPEQVRLVRASDQEVMPIADTAARLFYGRLFEIEPDLRRLFERSDMAKQRAKLMQTLSVAVAALDRMDSLGPALAAMGRRHEGYGVEDRHYAVVGAALLWTLEQGLGDGFTRSVRGAWAAAYDLLAAAMRGVAGGEEAPRGACAPRVEMVVRWE
jgi:hemoglobin-like flavoprotein